jgi:hypothetical protein
MRKRRPDNCPPNDSRISAEKWQLSESLKTMERLERGELETVKPAKVHQLFAAARRSPKR